MRVDFHMHTRFSDGGLQPIDLLRHVRLARLDYWAITDHDSLAGYHAINGERGLIPGVEITAETNGHEVHVVGLGVNPKHRPFVDFLAGIRAIRRHRIGMLIESLNEQHRLTVHGIAPEAESVTRFHLAQALQRIGRIERTGEAFHGLIGDAQCKELGLPAYPTIPDAACAIQDAGGVAILAHPGIYGNRDEIVGYINQGLDGLETSHPRLDETLAGQLIAHAQAHNLLQSCGSDTHVVGMRRPGEPRADLDLVGPLVQRLIA